MPFTHYLRRPLLLTVIAFALLFSMAAYAYPGGSHFDRHAAGHDFWRNTLCDVARSRALDGSANVAGATLAKIAMTILAIGLGMLFWSLPQWFARGDRTDARLRLLVRALGLLAVPAAIAVVFLPTDRFSFVHGIAIVVAGIPGFAAAILAMIGLARSIHAHAPRLLIRLGALALGVAAVDFAIYGDELVRGGGARLSVVVLERVATLLLLAWMTAAAVSQPSRPRMHGPAQPADRPRV